MTIIITNTLRVTDNNSGNSSNNKYDNINNHVDMVGSNSCSDIRNTNNSSDNKNKGPIMQKGAPCHDVIL